jgi:hypothetical protein
LALVCTEFLATSYTSNTQRFFRNLITIPNPSQIWENIALLIFSIRYTREPKPFNNLRQDIYNTLILTDYFREDPFEVLYQISETFKEESEASETSDEEDYNLDLLFQSQSQPQPLMATQQDIQNLTAALQALQNALPNTNNALQANTQAVANPPRRELRVADLPYFYAGNQDPLAWIEEFEKACNANGISNDRKIQVVPAYLKGAAATWWTTNQALAQNHANRIGVWTDANNNNTNFVVNFPEAFRTQTLIEIWTTELERRRQQPGESIDTYAAALLELYRRVEHGGFQYPEGIKARRFVNGLQPELYVNVKPHNDQTWQAAVDRAKSYELTYQDQGAVAAYMNKYAPINNTNQTDMLNQAIQNLTQQIQQINLGGRRNYQNRQNNYQPNNNQRNFYPNNQNNFNQQPFQPNNQYQPNNPYQPNNFPRNNFICYQCGQPGHTRRNCPQLRNIQPLNQPLPVAQPNDNNNNLPQQPVPQVNPQIQANQLLQMLAQLIPQNEQQQQQPQPEQDQHLN